MSNHICHACISFLNSWQSFKNRCNAAQKKQQNFVDLLLAKERAHKQLHKADGGQPPKAALGGHLRLGDSSQRILKNALLNAGSNVGDGGAIDTVS